MIFEYMKTAKYKNYFRNKQIFEEQSSGVFHNAVVSRVKLEFMGSGAITKGSSVFSGYDGKSPQFSPIADLVVPNNLLSAITNTYISYATSGRVLFSNKLGDTKENDYMKQKVKEAIREQSIGGSCLLKLVEADNVPYINIYNAISYFTIQDDYIQDAIGSYVIFNPHNLTDTFEDYLVEEHRGTLITYRIVRLSKSGDNKGTWKFMDYEADDLASAVDEDGVIFSYENVPRPIVAEVVNTCFNGNSDYTDDNVATLRELVVSNTINSQTFDKISNPLLALPEDALEYDENNNARVNLQDRVVIIRSESSGKPEQISLESKIEQSQLHKQNLVTQIYGSLAVNDIALGQGGTGNISGIALVRMLENTATRVEEKRESVAKAFKQLADIDIVFSDPITVTFQDLVSTISAAVNVGIMSQKEGTKRIGNEEDYEQIKKEELEKLNQYDGFPGPQ